MSGQAEVSGKDKRRLRAAGQLLKPAATVGKLGLTPEAISTVDYALRSAELVKVRIPAGPGPVRKAMGQALAQGASAACVGVVGRTVLLYRPDPDSTA